MDVEKYEKYMNTWAAVGKENERRIAEKFSECEKYIAENYTDCGCVFTKHDENLKKQGLGNMIFLKETNITGDRNQNINM